MHLPINIPEAILKPKGIMKLVSPKLLIIVYAEIISTDR